jgi:hypothetical protein
VPPHCDSLDGPVVTAARAALEAVDVDAILPFVPPRGEMEVRTAFELAVKARGMGGAASEVADQWFFESVVRIHRAGEGAPFTGLKPAGLDVGPVIPATERALETGSPDELADLLCRAVRHQVEHRLAHAMALKPAPGAGVAETREWVESMLGVQVWAHGVHRQIHADPHEHGVAHEHQ